MRKISTKNLYLCRIKQVLTINYNYATDQQSITCREEDRYALAHKVKHDYIDIFTSTLYKSMDDYSLQSGDSFVRYSKPIITNQRYLDSDIATKILEEANPTCIVEKQKTKTLKRSGK